MKRLSAVCAIVVLGIGSMLVGCEGDTNWFTNATLHDPCVNAGDNQGDGNSIFVDCRDGITTETIDPEEIGIVGRTTERRTQAAADASGEFKP